MIKVSLVVPQMGEDIRELRRFLQQEEADVYVFPEGFLEYVITGLKDTRMGASCQAACNGSQYEFI